MVKTEAIELLGGSAAVAAELMGVTYQAVNKWPEVLPLRIADRVLGVCVRNGIAVPGRHLNFIASTTKHPAAISHQAQCAINTEAKETAHA